MLCRLLCVLLFVAWTGEWPLDRDPVLYNGLWRSSFVVFGPLFVSIPGLNLFPWQILLGALVPFALLRPGAFRRRSLVLDGAVMVSFMSIALTFLWGFMRGGSAYQAYYQLWRFLAALVIGVILNSVLRRSSDLRALGVTVLLAALIRATLAIYFYWTIVRGRIDPPPLFMTNHDDSLLWVAGLLIAVAWAVASGRRRAWLAAAAVGALLLYAMVLNDRRLVWIELLLAFGVMFFLLPRGVRRRAGRWTLAAAPFVLAYVAVGWGRQEPVFAPVYAISSAGSVEDASSLARQEEIRNLLYTLNVAGNPLLGTGWGVAYLEATSVYTHFGDGFTLYPYQPHNSLLGVVAFAGLVGLFGIWLVVPVTAFLAASGLKGGPRPVDRAAAMASVCLLPAYGVQCYGDIGFQSFTGSLLLGVAMGCAAKLSVWAEAPPPGGPRRAGRA